MDTYSPFQPILRQALRLLTMPIDAAEQHPPVWSAILGGAGLGFVWGAAARIWMRLISTNPEFTIPGTVAILLIATLFGMWTGLAFAARRRGWRGWRHYLPRALAVVFFLPFGIAGGFPLMLTVLLATLGLVQRAVVGLWVLALLATLLSLGTDISLPPIVTGIALAGAIGATVWAWLSRRDEGRFLLVNAWLERLVRTTLLLLALGGFGVVAREVVTDKGVGLGLAYVLLYLVLLYPLFLALRVGLEPAYLHVSELLAADKLPRGV
jgi:hypothetical protein